MYRKLEQSEADHEWDDYRFIFNEWDYLNNNDKGDELIVIGGFIRKKLSE